MTYIVKATGPADLVAMIPVLVGFEPRNSVVLVAFRGSSTCGALRANLPQAGGAGAGAGAGDASAPKRFASHLLGTICKVPGVDSVVLAIYSDELFGGGRSRPHGDLALLLHERIHQSGFGLRDSFCVAGDGWASYLETDVPAGGHALAEITNSPAIAGIPEGMRRDSARPTRQDRVPDADPATMARVASELARYRRALEEVEELAGRNDADADAGADAGAAAASAGLASLTDIPALAEEALTWHDDSIDAHGALLLLAVQGPPVRDAVMLQWASSFRIGVRLWAETQSVASGGADFDQDLAGLMFGIGPRPDPDRLDQAISLMRTLVSRAPDRERLAPLCMLAWLSWAMGRGSVAAEYIDEARGIDPEYGMAQLLDTMLSNGILPEWAFASVE